MRVLFIALAMLLGAPLSGCATLRQAPLAPASSLLVVVEDAATAADADAREAAAVRSLATSSVRAYPSDASPELRDSLGDGAASERVARARAHAETLRVPWLLILGAGGARLEPARRDGVLWRSRGRATTDDERGVASFERAMSRRRGDLTGRPRLAPSERLAEIRSLALAGQWEAWTAAVRALSSEFPADPTVRAHLGLRAWLMESGAPRDGLDLARSMAPESESELLALAVAARDAGDAGFASRAWDALVAVYPERLDYHAGRSDAFDAIGDSSAALAACREGLRAADRDGILEIAKGTPPHRAPRALPFADLAFCAGYFLFEAEDWELAALAYEDAITIYEATDRFAELGEALNNAGVAMVQAERPLIGAHTLRKAVDVREELGARLPLANSRYNLGRALDEAGKPAAARISLDRAAGDYTAAGAIDEALETLVETLDLSLQQDDRDGFELRGTEILARLRDQPESPRRATIEGDAWFELGRGRLEFGDAEGSLAAYFRSLRVWQATGNKLQEGQTRYSMALPHLALMELEDSWRDLLAALEISVELGDSSSILAIGVQLDQIGDLFEQSGRTPPPVPEPLRRWVDPLDR